MSERQKKEEQVGKIAKIFDEMMKEIMPVPQKPVTIKDLTEMQFIEKTKEDEKKEVSVLSDSVSQIE